MSGPADGADGADGGDGIELRLAGPFAVSRGGRLVTGPALGSRKARLLLKVLAVQRPQVIALQPLVELLWGADPPRRPAESVATLVSRLRRELGGAVIDGGLEGYRLGALVRVDLDAARRWTEDAHARLAADEPGLALVAARRVLDLVGPGTALEDEPDAEWAEPARAELVAVVARARRSVAEAALRVGEPGAAADAAAAVVAADLFDEAATRLLMQAWWAAGEPARALVAYADLRALVARELGADPDEQTRSLHLRILRGEASPPGSAAVVLPAGHAGRNSRSGQPPGQPPELVGRDRELGLLRAGWDRAAAGRPSLLLVVGDPGIGKTRLIEELVQIARATGGNAAPARCYDAERSLFVQPVLDAVRALLRTLPPAVVHRAAGADGPLLAALAPEAADLLAPDDALAGVAATPGRSEIEIERRRAFEAVAGFVRRLSATAPLLLVLDDLQNAGLATVECLHFLTRQLVDSPVLLAATVRAGEGDRVLDALADVATRIEVGPLPPAAVLGLAAAAGHAELAESIMARTRGHALFVVETLRGLAAGESGVPGSLQAAVLSRVRRAGPAVEDLLRAGAVLGSSFDPATAALVLGEPASAGVAQGAAALGARLLVVTGRDYEFSNDLVREVLYETTPMPTRLAYHRRAADLLTDRPEAVARHAGLVGDHRRAARAWLVAGEAALRGRAAADAEELFGASLQAADLAGDTDVRARALVARSRAREALSRYDGAITDLEAALAAAREVGDRRLEMVALRALGGQPSIARGGSPREVTTHLHRGLEIATVLGDRGMEADFLAWLAVLSSNGLHFIEAVDYGCRALVAARAVGDDLALAAALDGRKTSLAYLGEVVELAPVLAELEPLLRRLDDPFRLHWALFEASFAAVAAGDWPRATAGLERALAANRRSGFDAYESWHVAHLGWVARVTGNYDEALARGREALRLSERNPHAWNAAVAAAQLGTTLLQTGAVTDAVAVLERGVAQVDHPGSEAYLLRCLAPLAEATRSPEVLARADAMLADITAPAGSAWLVGDGAYLGVARAWLAHGDPHRAREVLAPMLAAAARIPWVAPLADGCLVDGRAAAVLGRRAEAGALLAQAAELAHRFGLVRVAAEAAAALG